MKSKTKKILIWIAWILIIIAALITIYNAIRILGK